MLKNLNQQGAVQEQFSTLCVYTVLSVDLIFFKMLNYLHHTFWKGPLPVTVAEQVDPNAEAEMQVLGLTGPLEPNSSQPDSLATYSVA